MFVRISQAVDSFFDSWAGRDRPLESRPDLRISSEQAVSYIGDDQGGMRNVYPFRNQEAIGPIPLQTALFTWKDDNVLTRDGQPLQMGLGVWCRVQDVEKYIFKIYSDESVLRTQVSPYVPANYAKYPSQVAARQPISGSSRFDSINLHNIADQWLRVLVESTVRQRINQLAVADVVSSQAMDFLRSTDGPQPTDERNINLFDSAIAEALHDIRSKALDFGLAAERMEVQHVYLPKSIQDAINETRIAFLAPIRGEREAEAARIGLEKLVSVLGRDNVALNQIMSNLKGSNIVTPLPMFQPLVEKMNDLGKRRDEPPLPPPLPGSPTPLPK